MSKAAELLSLPVAKGLLERLAQVLIESKTPVAFFAYPNKPSTLSPPRCEVHTLATPEEDVVRALEALADELDAQGVAVPVQAHETPAPPGGAVTPDVVATAVGALLPEGAIVVDEAITAGKTQKNTPAPRTTYASNRSKSLTGV